MGCHPFSEFSIKPRATPSADAQMTGSIAARPRKRERLTVGHSEAVGSGSDSRQRPHPMHSHATNLQGRQEQASPAPANGTSPICGRLPTFCAAPWMRPTSRRRHFRCSSSSGSRTYTTRNNSSRVTKGRIKLYALTPRHCVDAIAAIATVLSAPPAPSATSDTPLRKHRP